MNEDVVDTTQVATLQGFSLEQVCERLRKELPEGAYTPVPTKTYLTDINPAYLYEALNDLFGLCGIGWGVEFDPERAQIFSEERQSANREYRMWVANLLVANLWYVYVYEGTRYVARIPTTGSSENEEYHYAVRGAVTAALSGAAKWMEWQFHIYAGQKNSATKTTGSTKRPTSTQKTPDGKPGLFVMPFGKHKGEMLLEIGKEDSGYLDWCLSNMTDKEDIIAAINAYRDSLAEPVGPLATDGQKTEIANRIVALTGTTDVDTSLKKRGHQPLAALTAEKAAELIKSLRELHFIYDESKRKAFWAKANELGLERPEVHVALGEVAHTEDFQGSYDDAIALLKGYVAG